MSNRGDRALMPRFFTLEMLLFTIMVLAGMALIWNLLSLDNGFLGTALAGIVFTLSLVLVMRLLMDPDSVRARQTGAVMKLSSQMLHCMDKGMERSAEGGSVMSPDTAQEICRLLLPATSAIAVAITDTHQILGYRGHGEKDTPAGLAIRTDATMATIDDGQMRILLTPEEIGFSAGADAKRGPISAAIIVPLFVGHNKLFGTLKFYYRRPRHVSETQKSIAEGLGELLSTQLAAGALEEQTKLATSMELKMLQSQINPHFLFNTINTIASLIRTDPNKARGLLREFAVFYRRTLEDSADLIRFSREMEQTQRYFSFEVARFGAERVSMETRIEPAVRDMLVPAFLIQPLVENAVRHAMPAEGKLTITVSGMVVGSDVFIAVSDDGTGMTEEACRNILHPESSTGLGIAVKNVHDRISGYFGADSHMEVESKLGVGTTMTLVLADAAPGPEDNEDARPAEAEGILGPNAASAGAAGQGEILGALGAPVLAASTAAVASAAAAPSDDLVEDLLEGGALA